MLSLLRAQVRSLVREQKSHKPCGVTKKKKKIVTSHIYLSTTLGRKLLPPPF